MQNPLNTQAAAEPIQRSPQFYRTRKALLFLPLFALPILVFAFWNFHHQVTSQTTTTSQGLNTTLPGAKFDKHAKPGDKMSFYNQAQQDSAKQQSANSNPLLQKLGFKTNAATAHPSALPAAYADPNVTKINQKLADINHQISQPQPAAQTYNTVQPADKSMDKQVTKLEMMMKTMNNNQGSDPQMQQLSKMLGQIQAIQHPETVKKDSSKTSENPFKAVPATIDGNQKVLQGGAVKLRLNDSLMIKGQLIPKGTLIFGTAMITNQRLLVEIKNIRLGNNIIPAGLTVYDKDGMPGVPAPEAEIAGAAGDGANNALETMQFMSMDQSLATQAASGGINAAKSLFSKKVKRIKIKLKNGYPVLLRNNQIH